MNISVVTHPVNLHELCESVDKNSVSVSEVSEVGVGCEMSCNKRSLSSVQFTDSGFLEYNEVLSSTFNPRIKFLVLNYLSVISR